MNLLNTIKNLNRIKLDEEIQMDKLTILARAGLVDDVAKFKRVLNKMQDEKQLSPVEREVIYSTFNKFADIITGDPATFQKARKAVRPVKEAVDPEDTGGKEEVSMIKGQVKQIKHYIEGIEKAIDKDGDVEEWVQNKLTKATDYLKSVYGYKLGQDDNEEMDEELKLTEEIEMAIEEGKRFGLTQSLLDAVKNVLAAETKPEEDKMDPVDPKALKGKHADRKDKDIDNDGDVDASDKYLHKRRQAVSKAMKENDDEEMEDDDDDDEKSQKKQMANNTDDNDEMSDEEKQKEKEYIAKKSNGKEKVDTKPDMRESLARRTLSRMMKDKENVKKGVDVPSHAERRAEMEKQKKERHIFTSRDAAVKKQHELGGKAKIVTGTGASAGKFLVVTEDLDLYEVTAYRVVNKKGTTIKSFGTDGSAAAGLARTDPDYKVVTDNIPFTPDKPKDKPSATAGKHGLGPSVAKHLAKKGMAKAMKEESMENEEMTPEQEKKREEIVMALKKKMPEFEAKYGDRAKEVMYATATKMAMKEDTGMSDQEMGGENPYAVINLRTNRVVKSGFKSMSDASEWAKIKAGENGGSYKAVFRSRKS